MVAHNELKLSIMGCSAFTGSILALSEDVRRQIFDYIDCSLIINGDPLFIFDRSINLKRKYSLARATAYDMYDTICARFNNLHVKNK